MKKYEVEFDKLISWHLTKISKDLAEDLDRGNIVLTDTFESYGEVFYEINDNFLISFDKKVDTNTVVHLHYPINHSLIDRSLTLDVSTQPFDKLVKCQETTIIPLESAKTGSCFYVQKLNYGGFECLKYGYTNNIKRRVKEQADSGVFGHTLIYLKYSPKAKAIEKEVKRLCKREYSPLVEKDLLKDGYSETCPTFMFDQIKEVAENLSDQT